MTPQPQVLLTRKDIARISGLSTNSIRRNEKSLGLIRFKVVVNCRLIRYRANAVSLFLPEVVTSDYK